MRAFELNARKIAHEESIATKFDLGKNVRLVPPFNESEVDKYLQHFERVAQNLRWPAAQWPLLLQSVLKGKVQEAYTALQIYECTDYNCVKNIILKAYELVPEVYCQKFRNYCNDYTLTHKSTFNKNRFFGSTKKSYPEIGKKSENVAPEKSSDKGQTSNQTMSKDRKPRSFAPVCHYCKKPGHVLSDCWLLKKGTEKEAMSNAFLSSKFKSQ